MPVHTSHQVCLKWKVYISLEVQGGGGGGGGGEGGGGGGEGGFSFLRM